MTDYNDTPHGYRVRTNTWTAYGPQLPAVEVFDVLARVDAHFDAAMQSLRPAESNDSAAITDPVDARIADLALDRQVLRAARVDSAAVVAEILAELAPGRPTQSFRSAPNQVDPNWRPTR